MTTLLISELFPPRVGGTPTWFHEVYRRYPPEEVIVLSDCQAGDEEFDARLSLHVMRSRMRMADWGVLHGKSARQYWRLFLETYRIVRSCGVGVIHCGRVMPEGVIAWVMRRLVGTRYFVYAHGEEIGTALASRELTFLMHRVYGAAKTVIANSQNTRRLLLSVGVRDDKIVVIHPGVDTDFFSPADDGRRIRERLGLAAQRVILTVGRLQRRKGHDIVLQALPLIAMEVPEVRYVVVGTGEEEPRLRSMAEDMGMSRFVLFAGQVPYNELPDYYRACDVFVMPNRADTNHDVEGFGIVFLEANACGKPVVAGLSGGTGEAIVEGETGLRVDGQDPKAVAEAVLSLLRNPGRGTAMGQRGRIRACQEFGWNSIFRRIRDLESGG